MKASELRPGQFFEFTGDDAKERFRALESLYVGRVWYTNSRVQLFWCGKDCEVVAVAGWDDEPCEPQGDTPIELLRYGPPPFKRPTLDDLEDAMIDSVDNMSTEEIEAALREAGIDMAPAISKLHAMIEATKATSKVNPAPSTPEPQPFKAGDLVVCVDPGAIHRLVLNNVYQISAVEYEIDGQLVNVDGGSDCTLKASRFRRATANELVDKLRQEPLQLREGAYYERRDGKVVGPAEPDDLMPGYPWQLPGGWYDNFGINTSFRHLDLIREVPPPVSEPVAIKTDGEFYIESVPDPDANEWPPELVAQLEAKRQDDEGWIEHDGTSMPVKRSTKVLLRIQTLDGRIDDKEIVHDAGAIEWNNTQRGEWKITHYRVVEQPPVRNIRKQPSTPVITGMGGEVQPAKYRPFASAEEFKPNRDRWLRYKHSAVTARVSWVRHDMVEIGKHGIYWRTLFHDYVFDDNGEPCGVME